MFQEVLLWLKNLNAKESLLFLLGLTFVVGFLIAVLAPIFKIILISMVGGGGYWVWKNVR